MLSVRNRAWIPSSMGCWRSQPVDSNKTPAKKGSSSDVVKLIGTTEAGESDGSGLDGEVCPETQSAVEEEAVREPFREIERSLSQSMAMDKDERYWTVDLKG